MSYEAHKRHSSEKRKNITTGIKTVGLISALFLAFQQGIMAEPIARLGATTSHGGVVVGEPNLTVLIGNLAASRVGDEVFCPQLCTNETSHSPGTVTSGSNTVLIGGIPVAKVGSIIQESCETSSITNGFPTVLVGP